MFSTYQERKKNEGFYQINWSEIEILINVPAWVFQDHIADVIRLYISIYFSLIEIIIVRYPCKPFHFISSKKFWNSVSIIRLENSVEFDFFIIITVYSGA